MIGWSNGFGSKPNVALVNFKIAGKFVFTPLTFIIIGFDTHPNYGIKPTEVHESN